MEDRGESRIRELGWLGVGALLGLVASLIEGARRADPNSVLPAPGPVAAWAVDRDAQEVCGLDEDLVLARSVRLGWPLAVRSRRDGGAWVLRSSLGSPSSPCRLARIRADGSIAVEIDLGTCNALALLDSGEALVVEQGTGCEGADRLLRCDDGGESQVVVEEAGLSCAMDAHAWLLVGTSRGEVLRRRPAAGVAPIERVTLESAVVDLAPGPTPGSAWVLFGRDGDKVGLLGPDLTLRWSESTGLRSAHLAPVEAEERVWIADIERPSVRRFGPAGALELDRADLPLQGLDRVVAWTRGSALLVTPGAILHVDRRGRMMPGQGGFDYLTDLDRVR